MSVFLTADEGTFRPQPGRHGALGLRCCWREEPCGSGSRLPQAAGRCATAVCCAALSSVQDLWGPGVAGQWSLPLRSWGSQPAWTGFPATAPGCGQLVLWPPLAQLCAFAAGKEELQASRAPRSASEEDRGWPGLSPVPAPDKVCGGAPHRPVPAHAAHLESAGPPWLSQALPVLLPDAWGWGSAQ